MNQKSKLFIAASVALLLSAYFFFWFIQTAWLGSFPGRDVANYAFWAYSQLSVAVALLIVAVIAFARGIRSP